MSKITALPPAGLLQGNEFLPLVQGGDTRRATLDQFGGMLSRYEAAREQIRARASLFGITSQAEARLFAAEATEASFADEFYRHGYAQSALADFAGWEVFGGPFLIDGRGLHVTGGITPAIGQSSPGDVTVVVEADVPAFDGTSKVLASYVGDLIESRVALYRSDTGIWAGQLYHPTEGFKFVPGPYLPGAGRMRAAFTVNDKLTRFCFAGGEILSIATKRPPKLLRLWLGWQALGYGSALNGQFVRVAIYPHGVTDEQLRAMTGGPALDDETTSLIDSRIRTHDNDRDAHELAVLRRQAELADSKTGTWTVRAADGFTGADGAAMGNTEIGNLPWSVGSTVRKGGRIQDKNGGFAGSFITTGYADGQIEADLYPGTNEASLQFRMNAATSMCWLLQRTADGGVTLYIQWQGATTRATQPIAVPVQDGERYKVRFIGPRIWVFRIYAGVETLLFDVTDTRLMTETLAGIRLNGGGSADNFLYRSREAL